MRRVVAIAAIGDFCFVLVLLHNDIKSFIWTHPWWHSLLVSIPGIVAPILAWFELRHSREANVLRRDANNQRERANTLQARIAELTDELDRERNKHLQQIANNTQRQLSEAEINARTLKKYIGKRASVTEKRGESGDINWGAMGAIIAEVNENNILTLFMPAGIGSSQAWGQPVRCDKLHVVEVPVGGCALQISIIERYGTDTTYGEARSWDERHVQASHARMQRGQNVFNAQYRKNGSPSLRHINIYAPTDGSRDYSMVTMEDQRETSSWYSSKLDIEKKFALVQVEWADQGYRYDGGSGSGNLNLFFRK